MVVETGAMRSMVWDQARAFNPSQGAASMTKLYCSDRALEVCDMAMDLMGAHSLLHANRVAKRRVMRGCRSFLKEPTR